MNGGLPDDVNADLATGSDIALAVHVRHGPDIGEPNDRPNELG